jgi:hypothetical protein
MRCALAVLVAAGAVLAPAIAAAQSATTTRIETRPFYGATVTLEEGVRVFRPLPPHDRVIINPGAATPLNLTIDDRKTSNTNQNSNYARGGDAYSSSGSSGYLPQGNGRQHRSDSRGGRPGTLLGSGGHGGGRR